MRVTRLTRPPGQADSVVVRHSPPKSIVDAVNAAVKQPAKAELIAPGPAGPRITGSDECAGALCCTDQGRSEVIDELIIRQLV